MQLHEDLCASINFEMIPLQLSHSHFVLQKYRLYLKKATQQVNIVAALGGNDSSYLRMGSLEGYGDFRALSGSGRLSSSFASSGIFGRLNSPASLNLRGIGSSGLIRPAQSQNTSNSVNTFGNLQPSSILPANQRSGVFRGIPTPIELSQSQPSNCTTGIGQLNSIDNSGGFAVANGFLDNRASVGSAGNPVPCVSSNHLMLQGSSQQSQNMGAFRNQSSLRAAPLNSESFDIGVCSSSNLLDYTRRNESWQGAVQLSKFPSNSLPLNETFNNNQLPPSSLNVSSSNTHIDNNPVEFSSASAIAAPLEGPRDELQCQEGLIGNVVQSSSYTPTQKWELHKQDYNQNMNCTFNSVNPLVSSNGVTSSLGQSLNQFNGATPSITRCNEAEKFYSDARMKSNDAYMLEQMKSHDGFIRSVGSLDDIMSAMVKRV